MRSAVGYPAAVSGATAIARGDLGPAAASMAGTTYYSADAAGTPPVPTTPADAKWLNAITEEIYNVLQLGTPATPGGLAFSDATNAQAADVLYGARGITADAVINAGATTVADQVGIAVDACAVVGGAAYSAAMASEHGDVEGDYSAAIASGNAILGAASAHSACLGTDFASVHGVESAAVACKGNAASTVDVTGDHSAAVSCWAKAGTITVSEDQSAAIGCKTDAGTVAISGFCSAAIACNADAGDFAISQHSSAMIAVDSVGADVTVSGVASAIIASIPSGAAIMVSGNASAAIGCDGGVIVATDHCVCLGGTNTCTPRGGTTHQVYGGSDPTPGESDHPSWRIDGLIGQTYALANNIGGADYAEYLQNRVLGKLAAGTIVTRRRQRCQVAQPGDPILGVVSAAPGVLGNSPENTSLRDDNNWSKIAMLGQAEVLVDGTVTNAAIDEAEAAQHVLSVKPGVDGIGTRAGWSIDGALEAMEVIRPGVCLCLIR